MKTGNIKISEQDYHRWLRAAYIYYYHPEDDSGMSDSEWDYIGRSLIPEEWPELKGTGYIPGQSLFWLKKEKYPENIQY